ncbi:MAG: PPC domain-containing DNA-binding protein [Chloroflexota bacterium]
MADEKRIEGMEPRFIEKVGLDVYFTRLQPGDQVMTKIPEICRELGIERAVILSGIGSLKDVAFADPKPGATIPIDNFLEKFNVVEEKGPFELLTLTGNVVPLVGTFGDLKEGDLVLHAHATLSAQYGTVIGGHLRKGTVWTTTELFLAAVKDSNVKKKQSTVTGLMEMRTDL